MELLECAFGTLHPQVGRNRRNGTIDEIVLRGKCTLRTFENSVEPFVSGCQLLDGETHGETRSAPIETDQHKYA